MRSCNIIIFMKTLIYILLLYLLIMNIVAFLMYGIDKMLAKKHLWRISESCLIIVALAGGSPGAYIGMYFFHHKTKKPLFFIGLPVILFTHFLLFFLLWNN